MSGSWSPDPEEVPFAVPAPFIVGRALLTAAEIAFGYRHGWVGRADVVALCLARYEAGLPLSPSEEAVALLLSDRYDDVDDLVVDWEESAQPVDQRSGVWLYLALAWLWENRGFYIDPLEPVELLFVEFDYPDEISHLVRYLPASNSVHPPGQRSLERAWQRT